MLAGTVGFYVQFFYLNDAYPALLTSSDALCEIRFQCSFLKASLSAYATPTFTTVLLHLLTHAPCQSYANVVSIYYIQPSITPLAMVFCILSRIQRSMRNTVCRLLVKVTFLRLAYFFSEFTRPFYRFIDIDCHLFKLCTCIGNFFVGIPDFPLQGFPLLRRC